MAARAFDNSPGLLFADERRLVPEPGSARALRAEMGVGGRSKFGSSRSPSAISCLAPSRFAHSICLCYYPSRPQPTVGDELWIVKTASGVAVPSPVMLGGGQDLDGAPRLSQRTATPVFATPEAAAANVERLSLGGKYCAKGGWVPA